MFAVSIRARVVRQTPAADVPALRARVGSTVPASLLKHLDDQAVAALDAVLSTGEPLSEYADWGIVACPDTLGRVVTARQFTRFATEGPWGVSPHVVPHASLHSLAGVLSLVLGVRGPNLGVGGLPGRESEALAVALPLLASGLPGIWVVWTRTQHSALSTQHFADALALVPAQPGLSPLEVDRFQPFARDAA